MGKVKILMIDDLYPNFLKFEKLVKIPKNEIEVRSKFFL